jgi:hypothetical protein
MCRFVLKLMLWFSPFAFSGAVISLLRCLLAALIAAARQKRQKRQFIVFSGVHVYPLKPVGFDDHPKVLFKGLVKTF